MSGARRRSLRTALLHKSMVPGDDTDQTGTYHGIVFQRFTPEAHRVLVLAQEEARRLKCGSIGTECLLLGLIHDGDGLVARALVSLGIPVAAVREKVKETVDPVGRSNAALPFTPRAKKVLELALREAHLLRHDYIGAEHMLLGLLREGEGPAPQVLVSLGTDLSRLRQRVLQLAATEQPQSSGKEAAPVSAEESGGQPRFYGGATRSTRRSLPWWRPLLPRRARQWRQDQRKREQRRSNAQDLREARTAVGMSLERLAEATGTDIEWLRDAESAKPQVTLSVQEWFKLAVVFEGHTWDEYQAQAAKVGPSRLLAPTGHMLEGARKAIRNTFSTDDPDDPGNEDT
jgi:ATP-dependent Clp protease ATP-binding subunit ClpA